MTRRPSWPTTFDAGQCGRSPYGSATASVSVFANSPSPEPSTTATSGIPALSRISAAASSTRSKYGGSIIRRSGPCHGRSHAERAKGMSTQPQLKQKPRNRRRDEVRQRAREHRAQSQPREIVAPGRRQRADPADLDPDRAEVRESAQRE